MFFVSPKLLIELIDHKIQLLRKSQDRENCPVNVLSLSKSMRDAKRLTVTKLIRSFPKFNSKSRSEGTVKPCLHALRIPLLTIQEEVF